MYVIYVTYCFVPEVGAPFCDDTGRRAIGLSGSTPGG